MIRRPWLFLLALLGALGVVVAIWTSIDRRPPEWDYANHLGRALDCYRILSEPGRDRFKEIIEASAFYPPVVQCAAGLLYFVFPVVPLTAQTVMLAYLAVALIAVFALGARLWDPAAGLMAAFLLGTAPFVVFSLLNFQLDLPLMAMVALALYALVRTDHFSRRGWSIGFGVAIGLGMVTKPPFAVYVLAPLLWAAWHALRAPDRRRRLSLLGLALVLAGGLAIPWYGPRLLGLPMQIANRSFKQAAESGHPETFTSEALLYYARVLPTQFGILAGLLFAWGAVTLRRQRSIRAFLWAGIVPFVLFSLIQNKNLRYTLPILPAAALVATAGWRALDLPWRRGLTWVCLCVGLAQVSMVAFLIPPPPRIPGLSLPMVFGLPPSRADWQHDHVLDDLVRESGGRAVTVSVVPNHSSFSVSNFRYEAARRRLPFKMMRAWAGPPFGVDFAIVKTGDQGPDFSVAKARRIMLALDGDPFLDRIYPVVGEYPLPDGSRAQLRMRRIEAAHGVTVDELARKLTADPARLLPELVREASGMTATLQYRPEALVRGEADSVTLRADTAVVGELSRKDRAPLRVREMRLRVEGLLFNPERLARTGHLELLDARALRLDRLRITEPDLREFLRGQPAGIGMTVRFADGVAQIRSTKLGPALEATVHLGPGREGAPFAIDVADVRVARVPIPGMLVGWVVRQFDPTPRVRNMPVAISVAAVTLTPQAVEVGAPGH